MFEYATGTQTCRFMPHTRLKDEAWYDLTAPDLTAGIYVLQCSTAQENVLTNNEWMTFAPGSEWNVTETGPASLKMTMPNQLISNKVSVHGGYSNMFKAIVDNGESFELQTTLNQDKFPLGIGNAYVVATKPSGLFRYSTLLVILASGLFPLTIYI